MAVPGITVHLLKDSTARPPGRVFPYRLQDYAELKRQCLQEGCLFTDPAFGPFPESLGYHKLGPGSREVENVVWKRPKDICAPRTPHFIREGMNRTDVCQGQTGDCWFLAAAASLTLYPRLLYRVVPQGQSFDARDYAGIFHFQLWQYGEWVDVVVDDYLPTQNGELYFVRSVESDEFWMPLLEKAYAKLNGSYEAMDGGYMNEAFVDFTGGIGETISLKTPHPRLFKTLKEALSKHSLMGAHIQVTSRRDMEADTPEGLVKGHAYSITGLYKLVMGEMKVRLLRLRNPWGRVEWNGRWSDRSPLWNNLDPALRKKLHVKREDGEFWMQLMDFVHHFDALEICHLNADWLEEGSPKAWNINCFQGSWVKGHTAGGHQNISYWDTFWMNPQFHVLLLEPDEVELKKREKKEPTCTLLVSLMQRDRRRGRKLGENFLYIYLDIFQVPKEYLESKSAARRKELFSKLKPLYPSLHGMSRDISAHFQLPPGNYLIIPSTYAPLQEAEFTLRIFTEKKHQFLELDEEIGAEGRSLQMLHEPQVPQIVEETFLDWAQQNQEAGSAELQAILNKVKMITRNPLMPERFSLEECLKFIQHFGASGTGKMKLQEFKRLWGRIKEWENIFINHDSDRSGTMNTHELQLALDAAGFYLNRKTREALVGKYGNSWLQIDYDRFVHFLMHLQSVFWRCKSRDADGNGEIYMKEKEWMDLAMSS